MFTAAVKIYCSCLILMATPPRMTGVLLPLSVDVHSHTLLCDSLVNDDTAEWINLIRRRERDGGGRERGGGVRERGSESERENA